MADEIIGPDISEQSRGITDVAGDMDILNELDDEPGKKKEVEEEEAPLEEEQEEQEEQEEEQEEEEQEEEQEEEEELTEEEKKKQLEEIQPDLSGKELAAKLLKIDPNIFKKVPGLRQTIFLEHEYSKLFPSPNDAKEAVSRLGVMDKFEESIMAGDSALILGTLAETDSSAYKKFADSILPNLYKYDRQNYLRITLPIVKSVIRNGLAAGLERKDENLVKASKLLSKLYFDSYEVPADAKPEEKNTEADQLRQEKAQWIQTRETEFENTTHETGIKTLRSEVLKGLDKIDISDFVRDALVEKVIKETNIALGKNPAHRLRIDTLWKKAKSAILTGNVDEVRSQIISTYLGGARTIMPAIRQTLLKQALAKRKLADSDLGDPKNKKKTLFKRSSELRDRFRPRESGGGSSNSGRKGSSDFYRKNSDMDILSGKEK